eukprot:7755150-Pyramimonas_sp.AAC.1
MVQLVLAEVLNASWGSGTAAGRAASMRTPLQAFVSPPQVVLGNRGEFLPMRVAASDHAVRFLSGGEVPDSVPPASFWLFPV